VCVWCGVVVCVCVCVCGVCVSVRVEQVHWRDFHES